MSQQTYPTDDWPDAVLTALGKIVVAAGQLDYVVSLALKRATGKPFSEGMADAAKVHTIDSRIQKVRNVIEARWPKEFLREFDTISGKIEKLWKERNGVVHALYGIDDAGRFHRIARISNKPYEAENLGVDVGALTELTNGLRYWRDRLNDFTREVFLSRPQEPKHVGAPNGSC